MTLCCFYSKCCHWPAVTLWPSSCTCASLPGRKIHVIVTFWEISNWDVKITYLGGTKGGNGKGSHVKSSIAYFWWANAPGEKVHECMWINGSKVKEHDGTLMGTCLQSTKYNSPSSIFQTCKKQLHYSEVLRHEWHMLEGLNSKVLGSLKLYATMLNF